MSNNLDFETKQHILDEFSQKNKKSIKCRIAALAMFIISWQLILHRDGFWWWMFIPGFFVTIVFVLMAGIYKYERSRCPFCGASLGYVAAKTFHSPASCPGCGELL